ncbi:MAG: hypothetical protein MI974_24790 [Chitinophagales bacterium]|nr:hypothetical protein [Chitinophagales bacterium]
MKSPILGFLLVLLLFIIACEKADDSVSEGIAQLRLDNRSPYTLDKVIVEPGEGGRQIYEHVKSGETSNYKTFDYLYRYAFIQAVIGLDTLTLQPIDYVGEERFNNGLYTYTIDITTEENRPGYMIVDFKID